MTTVRRPTQQDIARLTGVSRTTVSLVLNGANVHLRPEVRQSVLAAAERLGYTVNPVARNLAGGRNRLLGVYTFERLFPIAHRDFYYPFLLGIEEECETQAQDVLLFTSAADSSGRRTLDQGGVNRLRLADGCVLLGVHAPPEQMLRLAGDRMPFVFVGRIELPISYVAADHAGATAELIERLFALGHRRIGYFGSTDPRPDVPTERYEAYLAAGRRLRLPAPIAQQLPAGRIDASVIGELMDNGFTAFLAEMPDIAAAIRTAAESADRRVPDDISIAVLGDYGSADGTPWTTYHIPRQDMGRRAIRVLLDLFDDASGPRQVVLPCPIVAGATIGPARQTVPTFRRERNVGAP